MKKINFNSIISRLFLSFFLVISLIMTAGIFMFIWEKQTIKSQIEDSAKDNISFLKTNLESEINNIKLLQYNLASDTILNKLVTQNSQLSKSEYYLLLKDVWQRLKVMKNSNNYINDVTLYIPAINYIISASNGYIDFDAAEYDRLFKVHLGMKYPLIIDSNGIYSTSVHPIVFNMDRKPLYLAMISIPEDRLREYLGKFNKYGLSATAIYDYTSHNWIFNAQSSLNGIDGAKLGIVADASGKNLNTVAEIEGKNYYIVSEYSKYLNVSFIQYIPVEDIFKIPDQYGSFLWYYALLSLVIVLAYSMYTYRSVKSPINTLLSSFRRVEAGDLDIQVRQKAASEFVDLYDGFNNMVYNLKELIDRVYKQELYSKQAELKQLQSQINPHFLYNSYFLLYWMLKDREIENAESLAVYLGEYFQYITRNASEMVELQKEAEHAGNYAKIQQMRFSERLSVEFREVPEKFKKFLVPRLFLQPIIENSFEHGLKTSLKNGLVRIGFEDIGTGLLISVEDSGSNLQDDDINILSEKLTATDDSLETTGIVNVHKRIVLGYEPGSGISVLRSILGGLRVEIRLYKDDDNKYID